MTAPGEYPGRLVIRFSLNASFIPGLGLKKCEKASPYFFGDFTSSSIRAPISNQA